MLSPFARFFGPDTCFIWEAIWHYFSFATEHHSILHPIPPAEEYHQLARHRTFTAQAIHDLRSFFLYVNLAYPENCYTDIVTLSSYLSFVSCKLLQRAAADFH